MATHQSCLVGSWSREGAPAGRRGRPACGALVALVLVAWCGALPGLARSASAQQSAAIQATAIVASSYSSYALQADSPAAAVAAPERHAQRLAVPGVGVLEVAGAVGAQVRLMPAAQAGVQSGWMPRQAVSAEPAVQGVPPRLVQASIAYVAN